MIKKSLANVSGSIRSEWHFTAPGQVHPAQHQPATSVIDKLRLIDEHVHSEVIPSMYSMD
jgi:hypothetical protein